MAKMYPSKIPEHIRQNKIYRGEVQTYETLARLPDAFHVFYNPRVTAGPFAAGDDRLIDFVVLHEQWGMLSIEVKAGKIRVGKKSASIEQSQYNSKTRKWKWASIDPYAQLTRAFWKLVKLCEADGVRYRIPALFCVVFPSTSRQQFGDQRYSLLAGTIFCADDLPLLPTLLPRLLSQQTDTPPRGWNRDAFFDMRRRLSAGFQAPVVACQRPRNPRLLRRASNSAR
jgi:hypothetical protein